MILTGTEYRNTPFDIWAQLEFLYSGASGHVSFEKFKQFYGLYAAYTPGGRKELLALNAERVPLLKERIARHSFKVTKEEVLPYLPKKAFDILSCALSKEQSKAYAAVCDSLKLQFETYSGPASLTVSNFLSQMLRLAEITSGYAALDAQVPDAKQLEQILNNDMIPTLQRELYRFDPNPKLDLLVETLLDKEPTQKTQVWCAFRENVKQINARLRLEGIKAVMYYGATSSSDREIAVKSFNCDSDIKVFIGIASAGGVGLNLVGYDVTNPTTSLTNCDHAIYYSMNWSKVDYEQSQDRGHRMTTRVPLRISRLIVPNSIDGQILGRVEDKIEMAKDMSDISAILSKVLNPLGEN
jgi:SNF2 family DNA or RNA helicase